MRYEVNIVGVGNDGFIDFCGHDVFEICREMWGATSIETTDRGFFLKCSDGVDMELIRV